MKIKTNFNIDFYNWYTNNDFKFPTYSVELTERIKDAVDAMNSTFISIESEFQYNSPCISTNDHTLHQIIRSNSIIATGISSASLLIYILNSHYDVEFTNEIFGVVFIKFTISNEYNPIKPRKHLIKEPQLNIEVTTQIKKISKAINHEKISDIEWIKTRF